MLEKFLKCLVVICGLLLILLCFELFKHSNEITELRLLVKDVKEYYLQNKKSYIPQDNNLYMDVNKITLGNAPDSVNVIIEVSANSNVKYEMDKDSGALFVDRFLHTPMFYPANYGFLPQTLADDGDPLDALVLTRWKLNEGSVIKARPIGVLIMEDEKGMDEKIICVPDKKLDKAYENVNDIKDLPEQVVLEIKHFFEHYKDLENGKWVKVSGIDGAEKAKEIIKKFIKK